MNFVLTIERDGVVIFEHDFPYIDSLSHPAQVKAALDLFSEQHRNFEFLDEDVVIMVVVRV